MLMDQLRQLRKDFLKNPHPTLETRQQWLRDLKAIILKNKEALTAAVDKDFDGRAPLFTTSHEIIPACHSSIRGGSLHCKPSPH